jgi:ubiquinone/menaquinone biosynthesis C-methylase UbiE
MNDANSYVSTSSSLNTNPFSDQKVAESYDAFYDTTIGKWYDRWEKQAIKSIMPNLQSGTLLEMGSGTGHWCKFFLDLGYEVTGVDSSKAMIAVARRKNLKNVTFIQGNAEVISLSKKFNVVSFITTLEFISHPIKAIENAIKHLNLHGFLILGVLNALSPLQQSRKEDPIYSKGHYYSQIELEEIFSSYGTTIWKQCVYLTPDEIKNLSKEEIQAKEELKEQEQAPNGAFIAGRIDI